jgi:hypothetical protein
MSRCAFFVSGRARRSATAAIDFFAAGTEPFQRRNLAEFHGVLGVELLGLSPEFGEHFHAGEGLNPGDHHKRFLANAIPEWDFR